MDNFVETFKQFIEDKCKVNEEVKIQSSKLFETFKCWMDGKLRINNIVFTMNMKQHFPQFEYKRTNTGSVFKGLCLKEDVKIKMIPDYKQHLDKKREYNREYYSKNRDKVRTQQKRYYNIKCVYEEELKERSGITEEQLFKRKRLGLIKYIFNPDTTVNWTETITRMEKKVKEYIQEYTKSKDECVKDIDKNIECHEENYQRYRQLGNKNLSDQSVELINFYTKNKDNVQKDINKKTSELATTSIIQNLSDHASDLMTESLSHLSSTNIVTPKLKIVNIDSYVDTTYDIDILNLTKEDYIKFRTWHTQKSDDIWNLNVDLEEKNRILQEFYEKYDYVNEEFNKLYVNDEDYNDVFESIKNKIN